MKNTLVSVVGAVALLSAVSLAKAESVTLTMDETYSQPIGTDNLTVTKGFETFTFYDGYDFYQYNAIAPDGLTYIRSPAIEGFGTTPIYIGFSVPVSYIQFGLAETSYSPLYGAQFQLPSGKIYLFNLTLTDPYAEGQFTWSGPAVTGFWLTPAPIGSPVFFDNLTVASAPEPATWAMMLIGVAGLGLAYRRGKAGPAAL